VSGAHARRHHACRRSILLLSLAIAGGVVAGAAAERELRPVDEAARRADFFSFRAHLQMAVARRDADALLAAIHPPSA
jgi:hypothetical protein